MTISQSCTYCRFKNEEKYDCCYSNLAPQENCIGWQPKAEIASLFRYNGHHYERLDNKKIINNNDNKLWMLLDKERSTVVHNGYTPKSNGHDVGYVYILTNRAMPNHIKIGKTTKIPELRAQELSTSTGVPIPFQVYHCVYVTNHSALEKEMHIKFEIAREHGGREFFILSPEEAKKALDALSIKYIL